MVTLKKCLQTARLKEILPQAKIITECGVYHGEEIIKMEVHTMEEAKKKFGTHDEVFVYRSTNGTIIIDEKIRVCAKPMLGGGAN